jgi:hypothetical protein
MDPWIYVPLLVLLVVGGIATVRDTRRRSGRWGINLRRVPCPGCRTELPVMRWPRSFRQVLWGGWTCRSCGMELDKWGRAASDRGGAS